MNRRQADSQSHERKKKAWVGRNATFRLFQWLPLSLKCYDRCIMAVSRSFSLIWENPGFLSSQGWNCTRHPLLLELMIDQPASQPWRRTNENGLKKLSCEGRFWNYDAEGTFLGEKVRMINQESSLLLVFHLSFACILPISNICYSWLQTLTTTLRSTHKDKLTIQYMVSIRCKLKERRSTLRRLNLLSRILKLLSFSFLI